MGGHSIWFQGLANVSCAVTCLVVALITNLQWPQLGCPRSGNEESSAMWVAGFLEVISHYFPESCIN